MVLLRTPRIHVYEVSLTTGELASLHMNVGFNIHKDANFPLVGIPPAQMDLGCIVGIPSIGVLEDTFNLTTQHVFRS